MNNAKFYDDALEIVKQAVEADQKSERRYRGGSHPVTAASASGFTLKAAGASATH